MLRCFKVSKPKQLLGDKPPSSWSTEEIGYSWLSEVTYRFGTNNQFFRPDPTYIITAEEMPCTISDYDRLMRNGFTLRTTCFDILKASVENKERTSQVLDLTLWEVYESEAILGRRYESKSNIISGSIFSPFSYKAYTTPEWSYAAMGLLVVKILLVGDHQKRRPLLVEFFAILAELVYSNANDSQISAIDALGLLIAAVFLEAIREREWLLATIHYAEEYKNWHFSHNIHVNGVKQMWIGVDNLKREKNGGVVEDWSLLQVLQQVFH